MERENADLGAWSDDRAELAQVPVSSRGSDADIPEALRFGREVTKLVARRERRADAEFDRPAAFVLVPAAWNETRPAAVRRNPLLHTGNRTLTGQIHFVSAVLTGGSLAFTGDDAALFDDLDQFGVSSYPTLIYTPMINSSTLSYYPNGIAVENTHERWDVADVIPTADAITEVIDRVHLQELVTPDQSTGFHVWQQAARGWAHREAEARVQHAVKCGLAGAFRQCSIRPEQPGKIGRTDLEIVTDENRPPDQIVHHAVLEMKVLREKGETGRLYTDDWNNGHMREGLLQSYNYGESRSMRERLLCCFDMRATDAGTPNVFAFIHDEAENLQVHLRRWFLYRTSELWREARAASALICASTPTSPRSA